MKSILCPIVEKSNRICIPVICRQYLTCKLFVNDALGAR